MTLTLILSREGRGDGPGVIYFERKKIMGTKDFGVGLAVGLLVGAAFGMLYAPRAGEENRAMLREKADSLASNLRQQAGNITSTVRERAGSIRERVADAVRGDKGEEIV